MASALVLGIVPRTLEEISVKGSLDPPRPEMKEEYCPDNDCFVLRVEPKAAPRVFDDKSS